MKIPSTGPRTRVDTPTDSGASVREGTKSSSRRIAPAAQVQMSTSARAMDELRSPEQPSAEKVQRLREAIARGELPIDVDRIAERMLEEELG